MFFRQEDMKNMFFFRQEDMKNMFFFRQEDKKNMFFLVVFSCQRKIIIFVSKL